MRDGPVGATRLTAALLLAVLVAGAAVLRDSGDAVAQSNVSSTRVIFAIDNSGSMFGKIDGELPSDPGKQRIQGVLDLIEKLQLDLIEKLQEASGEERVVELGALLFGGTDKALVVLSELVKVEVDPANTKPISELVRELKGQLSDTEHIGGGTDFLKALCGAWTLATREPPPPDAGCPTQTSDLLPAAGVGQDSDARILVVLITDGGPAAAEGTDDLTFGGPDSDYPDDACLDGYQYASGGAEENLCSLAETWRVLGEAGTAELELVVIGLDEGDQWFGSAASYWMRVAQCGAEGQPDCEDRVVLGFDQERLAEQIRDTVETVVAAPSTPSPTPSETTPTPSETTPAPSETATPSATAATPTPTPPSTGEEEEVVRIVDSPVLRTVLYLLVLAAITVGVSAVATRRPHRWRSGDEPAQPVDLFVPDEYRRPVSVVRLGLFVWCRTVPEEGRDEPGRLLTLRWLVFGPLVARDTSGGAPMRDLLLGRPTGEADSNEARRLDLRRRPRRRPQP